MVCIQRNTNPAIIVIILNRIFNQIAKCHSQFYFIHLCCNRTNTFKNHLNIPLIRNRLKLFQNCFEKFINIDLGNIDFRCIFIHFYKGKQIIDNFIHSLQFFINVHHKFLIKFNRNIFLSNQRFC